MSQRIYNYCIHLLARQDYSEYKLRQKLRSKPQNLPHEIEEAIEKVKERGLLSEENYRRLFIRKWLMKGESANKIRRRASQEELQLSEEEFHAASVELGLTSEDSIQNLIEKKLRMKEIPKEREAFYKLQEKTLRFLISKGHSYEEAKTSLNAYMKEHAQ
jgi:SOS response regulatory protein OraA/RecX